MAERLRIAVADDAVGRFLKRIDRGRFVAGTVFHVIDGHADDIRGLGQRRPNANLAHWGATALANGLF